MGARFLNDLDGENLIKKNPRLQGRLAGGKKIKGALGCF